MVIVTRFTDIKRLEKIRPPILVYGRRKVGKTFLIKNYFQNFEYFFVRRDRSIFWENKGEVLSYEEFLKILELIKDKLIIIDEFHRLSNDFLDYIHQKNLKNLVLITSTVFLAKKMIGEKSPLLGLFLEYKVEIIDERDILINLSKYFEGKELIERSIFLREPILLNWYNLDFAEIINSLKITVPALIGEIFTEEDRKFVERYEGILRAVASGKQTLTEISSFLYKRKIIEAQNPMLIKPYLNTLVNLGLIKRYEEYRKKGFRYFVSSPLIDIYFYLDEKYNFSEENLDKKYLLERIPFYVEDFFRNLFSKIFNQRIFIINEPNLEIDIVLGDFRKIKLVGEVKWKEKVNRKEIFEIENKLNTFKDARKILIVPEKSCLETFPSSLEVFDVNDIISLVKEKFLNRV